MRHAIKRVVERAAILGGVTRVGRAVNRHRALVLMYHNILARRGRVEGDASLHLARDEFARQLDHLQRVGDVVSLDALIDGDSAAGERCRIAITFDDAYLGAVSLGVDELVGRGLPATIFVPPGALGQEMWWDLFGASSPNGMDREVRAVFLREFRGRADEIRRSPQWRARHAVALQPELRIARADELDAAAARPGISVGSHTWSHPNLAVLDDALLDEELGRPYHWLRGRYPSFRPYLTYPYGESSPRVERAAERVGYTAAFRADGGWFHRLPGGNRFALPRFDVSSGLSLDGFQLRLAGFALG